MLSLLGDLAALASTVTALIKLFVKTPAEDRSDAILNARDHIDKANQTQGDTSAIERDLNR